MKLKDLLVVAIFLLALFVRFYNFGERITFGPEQARSLFVSGRYISDKPSFLGQEYFRVTSYGHKLFSGALFSYSLVPLQIIFKYDALPLTGYFTILNVFSGLALFWVVRRILGEKLAIFALILFLFNDYMIYHSLFIWILNYLPLVGIALFYLLYLYLKKPKFSYSFMLGVLSGIGINLQYLFIPIALAVLFFVLWKSNNKLKDFALFTIGSLVGNFPMVIFDLRHNFYHLRSLWQYLLDTLAAPSRSIITYYHFLPIWPLFIVVLSFVFLRLWEKNKALGAIALAFYLYINLTSSKISFKGPTGMPEGLLYSEVIDAGKAIAHDAPSDENFNVVALLDFDTRGFILRYPVEFMFGKRPRDFEDYPNTPTLYVLSDKSYNFASPAVWELKVNLPYKYRILKDIDERYAVFKITHED